MKLRELAPELYAKFVLPESAELWAHGRSLGTYVAQTLEVANSPYGRQSYRTFGLYDGSSPVASFKRYARSVRFENASLRAFGIGAVFTTPQARGKGYASAMLAMMLDDARRAGVDVAYLFSDIHPQFYKEIGFLELPSRLISVRADALDGGRIEVDVLGERDWTGVRKCFNEVGSRRPWAFERSPIIWDWVRLGMRHRAEHSGGQPMNLVVRRGRGVGAYVLGQREPAHDCYVVDEFGFVDDAARESVPRLLRSAAGDLRRITGWLPPLGARELLPRGSVRRRNDAIWMAAPLSPRGAAFVRAAQASSPSDGVWSTDHI